jgi:MFS family permease
MSRRVATQFRTTPNSVAIGNTNIELNKALESEDLDFSSSAKKRIYSSLAGVSGLFIGYEASSVNGVIRSRAFIDIVESPTTLVLTDDTISSILTLLYCGAFIGSIAAGYSAEHIGRRLTIIAASCLILSG